MSETFFNPDLVIKPGGDEVRTMGGISVGVPGTDTYRFQPMQPEDTFFNPDLQVTPGGDTVTTMGGLDALPSENAGGGNFDLGQFIGSAAQLAQLYPGIQNRPQYEPGLTDLRYTRSFTGAGEPGGSFYSPSGAGGVAGPPSNEIVYQQPLLQPQTQAQGALNEALLAGLLGMDWTGAYNDYLRNLAAQTQDINISNVVSPTMTNIQQQSQEQAQYMGGRDTSQEQDQDQDRFDDIDVDSYIRDYLSGSSGTSGGGLDDFFNKGPVTPGDELPSDTTGTIGTGDLSPVQFIQSKVQADQAAKAAAETAFKKRIDESVKRFREEEAARKAEEAHKAEEARLAEEARQAAEAEAQRQEAARQAEEARLAEEARQRRLAEEAEAQRQAAAAEAERQRQAALQAEAQSRAAPILDQATTKFQSDIQNAVAQRDAVKKNLDAAATKQVPQEVINELQASYETLNNVLKNYNVDQILRDPNYAREQALQSSSGVLKAFSDPNNPPPPAVVDGVFSKAVSSIGADVIAKSLTNEGAKAVLEAAGPEFIPGAAEAASKAAAEAAAAASAKALEEGASAAAAEAAGQAAAEAAAQEAASEAASSLAGDIAGPAAAAIISLAQGDSVGTAAAQALKAYVVSVLMTIPVYGQAIGVAIMLDSVLSKALGYESPIDQAVVGAAKNIDKAVSWIGRGIGSDPVGGVVDWAGRSIGSDPLGGISDWISKQVIKSSPIADVGRAITAPIQRATNWVRRTFGFEEGGLVDLGEDSMYNEYDDYGGLFGLPFEVVPDMYAEQPMMYARGGVIPLPGGGKIARGPGGGLDDLIPTSIDGRRAAALSDGEFVIPADVVSMMGDGSSNAGAKRLYDLVRQIRQDKTGTSKQAGPLQVGKILERTMR